MEASITQVPNQAIMIWVLFGLLMVWMVTFAMLALWFHPRNTEIEEYEDLPTPANSFPIIHAPMVLQVITPTPQHASTTLGQESHDTGDRVIR